MQPSMIYKEDNQGFFQKPTTWG